MSLNGKLTLQYLQLACPQLPNPCWPCDLGAFPDPIRWPLSVTTSFELSGSCQFLCLPHPSLSDRAPWSRYPVISCLCVLCISGCLLPVLHRIRAIQGDTLHLRHQRGCRSESCLSCQPVRSSQDWCSVDAAECPFPFSRVCPPQRCLPGIKIGNGPQGVRVGMQMLELCLQAMEGGPTGSLIGPAVLHEFIQGRRAVHGRGQPVPILNALHYLQ